MKLHLPFLLAVLSALTPRILAKYEAPVALCLPLPDGEKYDWAQGDSPNRVVLGPLQCSEYFNPTLGVASKIVQCFKGVWYTRETCDMEHYCIIDIVGRPVCKGLVEDMRDKHQSLVDYALTATAFPTTMRFPTPTP